MLSSGTVSRRTFVGKSLQNINDDHQNLNKNNQINNTNKFDLITNKNLLQVLKRKPRKRRRQDNKISSLISGKTVSRDLVSDSTLIVDDIKPDTDKLNKPREDKTNKLTYQLEYIKKLLCSPEWTKALKPQIDSNQKLDESEDSSEFVAMNSTSTLNINPECYGSPNNSLDNDGPTLDDELEYSYWQNSTPCDTNWQDESSSDTALSQNAFYDVDNNPISDFPPQDLDTRSDEHFTIPVNVSHSNTPSCFWDSFAVKSDCVTRFNQPTSMADTRIIPQVTDFLTDFNYNSNKLSLRLQVSEVTTQSRWSNGISTNFNETRFSHTNNFFNFSK